MRVRMAVPPMAGKAQSLEGKARAFSDAGNCFRHPRTGNGRVVLSTVFWISYRRDWIVARTRFQLCHRVRGRRVRRSRLPIAETGRGTLARPDPAARQAEPVAQRWTWPRTLKFRARRRARATADRFDS